jgi:hypothetical protein
VGQRIDWEKGRKATHESCGETTPVAAQTRRPVLMAGTVRAGNAARFMRGGTCREPGCSAPAVRGGYCASCAFDEYD